MEIVLTTDESGYALLDVIRSPQPGDEIYIAPGNIKSVNVPGLAQWIEGSLGTWYEFVKQVASHPSVNPSLPHWKIKFKRSAKP